MYNFIEWLKIKLQQDLPGSMAQNLMAPKLRQLPTHYLQNNPNPKNGSVNVLLYFKQNKIYSILTLRSSYIGTHSAQVSFPGGKIEQNETVLEAAIRETFEEIGVAKQQIFPIGNLTPLYIPASNFLVHPVVSVVNNNPLFIPNAREVSQIIEFPLHSLFDDGLKKETVITTSYSQKISAPYYEINKQVVWGATAMILSEFEQLLLPYKNKL